MHQSVINQTDFVAYMPCHPPPQSSQWQGLKLLMTHHRFSCWPLKQLGGDPAAAHGQQTNLVEQTAKQSDASEPPAKQSVGPEPTAHQSVGPQVHDQHTNASALPAQQTNTLAWPPQHTDKLAPPAKKPDIASTHGQ